MVSTRGKKIKFDLDSSEVESDDERDVERPAEPLLKRRKTKKSKSGEEDSAFTLGSSAGKGKGKATLIQNQLITRRSGRGGKLRDLMNMPVDIFTEICFYLGPHDLRRLALTSKRLWDILMTKEVRHIWKATLASVPDLPECPSDLNEPQYICLLYSSECYTIGCTSRGTKADWFHRVRFCSTCHQSKMVGEGNLGHSQTRLELGLKECTLSQIRWYFSSRAVMQSYSLRRGYYVEALKKAGTEYEKLSKAEAEKYLSTLKEIRDYRLETGKAMLEWKNNQEYSRADDIAAEKNARFESIKAKLLEIGWETKDFPMSNKEFKDLVLKDQKLTPKIWQNIRWKLEPLLETGQKERLEREKRQRRSKREDVICKYYHQLAREIMDLPFQHYKLGSILCEIEEVFALPSIKPLLESDTETITEEQWIEVAPDVRYMVLKWWRDTLKRLVDSLGHSSTARPDEASKRDDGTVNSEDETEEAISGSIEVLRTELSYATSVFCCNGPSSYCKKIYWFPDNLKHGLFHHNCSSISQLLIRIQPLHSDGQHLVQRLLVDLKLDPETVGSSEVATQMNFLCTRCDQRVVRYMGLNELIGHYLNIQKRFDDVTGTVRTSPNSSCSSQPVNNQSLKIVDDHDWISRDAFLARQDDNETKEVVLKLQSYIRRVGLTALLCDKKGIRGFDLEASPWRDILKIQNLTPKVWQNMKPKLEPLLEICRNELLEMEKQQRRNNRENAMVKFYHRLGGKVTGLWLEHAQLCSLLPNIDGVFALPSIKLLLENDTETVTEEQWIEVTPEVRFMIVKWWRDSLRRIADSLGTGVTGSSTETNKGAEGAASSEETEQAVSTSVEGLRAKLSHPTSVFSCGGFYCKQVWRFPYAIKHALSYHCCRSVGEILDRLRPLGPDGQELVKRLLKDLKLDPGTVKSEDPVDEDENQRSLLCTMCDERVAKYMSLNELIQHFLHVKTWFDKATGAVRASPNSCYPSPVVESQVPKIVNDHDWAYRDGMLVRQDDAEMKDTVSKLQSEFRKEGLIDPLCDTEGIGGEDLEKNPWREVLRCCLLCPKSFAPQPDKNDRDTHSIEARKGTRLGKRHNVGKLFKLVLEPLSLVKYWI